MPAASTALTVQTTIEVPVIIGTLRSREVETSRKKAENGKEEKELRELITLETCSKHVGPEHCGPGLCAALRKRFPVAAFPTLTSTPRGWNRSSVWAWFNIGASRTLARHFALVEKLRGLKADTRTAQERPASDPVTKYVYMYICIYVYMRYY